MLQYTKKYCISVCRYKTLLYEHIFKIRIFNNRLLVNFYIVVSKYYEKLKSLLSIASMYADKSVKTFSFYRVV
jgi:hypothetical protein